MLESQTGPPYARKKSKGLRTPMWSSYLQDLGGGAVEAFFGGASLETFSGGGQLKKNTLYDCYLALNSKREKNS